MRRVVVVAIAMLGAVHAGWFHDYLTDDAFISFRYLDHWLAGEGLSYNPGERVWGFTNFGWIVTLAPFRALGIDPVVVARSAGLLATALLVAWVACPRAKTFGAAEASAMLLLVTNGGFLLQAWGGLETAAFTALLAGTLVMQRSALARASTSGAVAAGLLAATATLFRPEGALAFAGALFLLRRKRPSPGRASKRALWAITLAYTVPVALVVLGLQLYFDAPWPNSIRAKVGASWEQVARGAHYVSTWAVHYTAGAAVLLAAAAHWRRLDAFDQTLVVTSAALVALVIAAGGDWMFGYRLLHPVSAFSAALLPGLLNSLAPRSARVVGLAVVLLATAQLGNSVVDPRVRTASRETYVHQGIRIGRWMRENLPPHTLLATNTAGTIPYYSGLPTIDMMGLSDRTIAMRRDLPPEWKGIEKGDGRYVLEREPDLIQFASALGSARPMFLSDIEIFLEPSFHRRYDRVELAVDPETRVTMFRRRETPRTAGPSEEEWRHIREMARRQIEQSRYRY